jgi:hypothetical protein
LPKYQIVETATGEVVFESRSPQAVANESARLMRVVRAKSPDAPPPYTIKGLDSVTLPDARVPLR